MADTTKPMFENIHISDDTLYQQFLSYYSEGNYSDALNLLSSNAQLVKKITSATNINLIISNIMAMEQLYSDNSTFQKEQIPVSASQPSGQKTGQVWFQIIQEG